MITSAAKLSHVLTYLLDKISFIVSDGLSTGRKRRFLVNTCARYYLDFLWLGLAVPKSILDSTSLLTESMTGILVSDKQLFIWRKARKLKHIFMSEVKIRIFKVGILYNLIIWQDEFFHVSVRWLCLSNLNFSNIFFENY